MSDNYYHLHGFTKERLAVVLRTLTSKYDPKDQQNISVGDIVEFRKPDTLSQVCQVTRFLVDKNDETECGDTVTKIQLTSLKRYRCRHTELYGDFTNVFPLNAMKERLLQELKSQNCNEAIVEFETFEIVHALQKLDDSKSSVQSSKTRQRSRTRDRIPKSHDSSEHNSKPQQTNKHRTSSSQSSHLLKFSARLTVKNGTSSNDDFDFQATCINWRDQVTDDLDMHFGINFVPASPEDRLLLNLLRKYTPASYCLLLHNEHQGDNYALHTTVIDGFMSLVSKIIPDTGVRFAPRELINRLCTCVQFALSPTYKQGGVKAAEALQSFRELSQQAQSICFTICRDNHHYVIFMQYVKESRSVEVVVLDSLWKGSKNRTWRGPLTVGMNPKKTNTEEELNQMFPNSSKQLGLDTAFKCSLAYLAHKMWDTPLKDQKVVYRFPTVPYQGLNNTCGVHAIYHMVCLLQGADKYIPNLLKGEEVKQKTLFSQETKSTMLSCFRNVLDSFSVTDRSAVLNRLRKEIADGFPVRFKQNVSSSANLHYEEKFPDLTPFRHILTSPDSTGMYAYSVDFD